MKAMITVKHKISCGKLYCKRCVYLDYERYTDIPFCQMLQKKLLWSNNTTSANAIRANECLEACKT